MRLRNALTALLYGFSLSSNSMAEIVHNLDIPDGELTAALELLARQTHVEFIYSADDTKGVKTRGVHGDLSAEAAIEKLLEGTHLVIRVHPSGTILITRDQDSLSGSDSSSKASGNRAPPSGPPDLNEIVVIGTRRAEPLSQVVGAGCTYQSRTGGSDPRAASERALVQLFDHERRYREFDVLRPIEGVEFQRYASVDRW
jgi:hypothetical protein